MAESSHRHKLKNAFRDHGLSTLKRALKRKSERPQTQTDSQSEDAEQKPPSIASKDIAPEAKPIPVLSDADRIQSLRKIRQRLPSSIQVGDFELNRDRDFREWALVQSQDFSVQSNQIDQNGICSVCAWIGNCFIKLAQECALLDTQFLISALPQVPDNSQCMGCAFFQCPASQRIFRTEPDDCYLVALPKSIVNHRISSTSVENAFAVLVCEKKDMLDFNIRHVLATWVPGNYSRYPSSQYLSFEPQHFKMDSLPQTDGISSQEYNSITNWLATCRESHSSTCSRPPLIFLSGLKFIDCLEDRIVTAPAQAEYIALSYVWGSPSPKDTANYSLLSNAPLTIRDAMKVTVRLGFRYLWVDRYCIDQENVSEVNYVVSKMNFVYAGAVLTIIAAAGSGPDVGLPGVSTTKRETVQAIRIGERILTALPMLAKKEIEESTWSTRGWTYQEAVLSARRLVFNAAQTYMQCNLVHTSITECPQISPSLLLEGPVRYESDDIPSLQAFQTDSYYGPDEGVGPAIAAFQKHVRSYWKRKLSHESDKFKAIQGVLQDFQYHKSRLYNVWGIPFAQDPEATINHGLLWKVTWEEKPLTRCIDYPSWSWAGWSGQESIDWCEAESMVEDTYNAAICIELRNGFIFDIGMVRLTEGIDNYTDHVDDIQLVSPFLLVEGYVFPMPFEKRYNNWCLNDESFVNPFDATGECTEISATIDKRRVLSHMEFVGLDGGRPDQAFRGSDPPGVLVSAIILGTFAVHFKTRRQTFERRLLLVIPDSHSKDGHFTRVGTGCIKFQADWEQDSKRENELMERKRIRLG